jgi:sugar lactone lactonase YvrE
VVLAAGILLPACGASVTATPPSTPVAPPSATVAATPSPVASPVATLSSCAAPRDLGSLEVLHHFSVSPDDIAADAHGDLWATALAAGQLIELDASGAVLAVHRVAGGPEGVAVDGADVYVAQQNLNAVRAVLPTDHQLVSLPNHTTNAGIDGIALDIAGNRLLIPDSPNGRLVAVGLAEPHAQAVLAGGLGRPVAAAVDGAGTTYVASESAPGLTAISAAGATRTLGHFTNLDEVVADHGLLYVTELDRRDVLAVDPVTGASVPVAVNLPSPQGLAVTSSGALAVIDATTNTLYVVPACRGAA